MLKLQHINSQLGHSGFRVPFKYNDTRRCNFERGRLHLLPYLRPQRPLEVGVGMVKYHLCI